MKTTTDIALPSRKTPIWESARVIPVNDRESFLKVISGRAPIGLLERILISDAEREYLVDELFKMQIRKYDNTDESQRVLVYGKPFVDCRTVTEHLTSGIDEHFEKLTSPLFNRLLYEFRRFGFDPQPMIDPVTLLPFPSKVCRLISIPKGCYTDEKNECTVLHCDDFVRDGLKKSDFRLPIGYDVEEYFQFSCCVQFETGGYMPDALFVYEQQYSRELETTFMLNGWQYPIKNVEDRRVVSYIPQVGKCYFFPTQNFHDVRGGDPRAKRLNFSVFFIFFPKTNVLFYYN